MEQFKKGDRVQTLSGDIRGRVTSSFEDKKGLWYRIRSDIGQRVTIFHHHLIRERKVKHVRR